MTEIKISEAILILSDSLRKRYRSVHQTKSVISMTIMAWNLSLLPNDEKDKAQQKIIESLPDEFSGDDGEVLLASMGDLIKQKKKLYPFVREYILNYELSLKGSEMTLNVATVPIEEENTTK